MATPKRPMSPFMIGPYYRPQLTSVLSIMHRGTGVFLALGGFALAAWLVALAGGSETYADFSALLASVPGRLVLLAMLASLVYHLLNGIRHLLWDIGWGFELRQVYASGWTVVVLTLLITAAVAWAGFGTGDVA
jgi:succinate dehydrogenase / fumarate reductase cytochrome b subunit